jgi:hypothetical protein
MCKYSTDSLLPSVEYVSSQTSCTHDVVMDSTHVCMHVQVLNGKPLDVILLHSFRCIMSHAIE